MSLRSMGGNNKTGGSSVSGSNAASGNQTAASNNNNATSAANSSSSSSNDQNKLNELFSQSKDAQTMSSVLKDMGIESFEPRVVNQLLEFSYRYITNLLEDAKAFSNHAGKKTIDSEDIKMAIKSKVDYSFTTTPPRDLLMEISKSKNKNPLPPIKYHAGIRLPPDRFCLHATNYALKTQNAMNISQSSSMLGSGQNRQSFSNVNQTFSQVSRSESSFVPSAIPVKRPRADDDDYDI